MREPSHAGTSRRTAGTNRLLVLAASGALIGAAGCSDPEDAAGGATDASGAGAVVGTASVDAGPTLTQDVTGAGTGTVMGADTDGGTDTPSGSTTGTPATTPPIDDPAAVPTTIGEGVDLFPDGASPGVTVTGTSGPGDAEICPGAPLPGLDAAVAVQAARASGPEWQVDRALYVFEDARAAVGFMTGLETEAESCPSTPREDGRSVVVSDALPGPWGRGLIVMTVRELGPGEIAGTIEELNVARYTVAVRDGSAVLVTVRRGEFFVQPPYTIGDGVADSIRSTLRPVTDQMCRWTLAGCP